MLALGVRGDRARIKEEGAPIREREMAAIVASNKDDNDALDYPGLQSWSEQVARFGHPPFQRKLTGPQTRHIHSTSRLS